MNFLAIDGTKDKVNFFLYFNNNCFNKFFESSKTNNEKFSIFLFDFLNENNIKLNQLNHLFINQGPGKFSGIRTSIVVAKALSISNKLNLYGFNDKDLKNKDYLSILNLYKKGLLIKNLIKPVYLS